MLEIHDLRKAYRAPDGTTHTVVDVPRLHLAVGEQVALAGTSGAGKTTLLHLIAGILRADAGRILIDGTDITALREAARDDFRARHVGYVFQTFNLLRGYTALENVELGMAFGRGIDAVHAAELLDHLGLGDRLHHRPDQLSTGQQQRVAVARALANRPQLVLADEPTGNLDPHHAREAIALLQRICREEGAALLVVTHDHRLLDHFDRAVELADVNRAAAPATSPIGATPGIDDAPDSGDASPGGAR